VTDALVADGKSRHYTNRFQQLTMSRAKKPLEKKVRTLLGEKLVKLKAELDDLRDAKLTNADGHAPFNFELEGIVGTDDDSRKLRVVQSIDLSSELKQSVEAILKRRNIDTDELFLSEFQAAAVSALKQPFKNANKLRQIRGLPELPPMELLSMDTLRGISRDDLDSLRRMAKQILHKHHEHPSTTKESSKDDASELGKVLNLGEAIISERSLRGMSNAELLKLTKMAKEILVEVKKNDKTAAGEGLLVGADGTSRTMVDEQLSPLLTAAAASIAAAAAGPANDLVLSIEHSLITEKSRRGSADAQKVRPPCLTMIALLCYVPYYDCTAMLFQSIYLFITIYITIYLFQSKNKLARML
jgi:hypothetical protein